MLMASSFIHSVGYVLIFKFLAAGDVICKYQLISLLVWRLLKLGIVLVSDSLTRAELNDHVKLI